MNLPPWVAIAVGALVIFFGVYRIRLGLRSRGEDEAARKRGGLYGMPRRTHLLIGVVYVLMGLWLVLAALGVRIGPKVG